MELRSKRVIPSGNKSTNTEINSTENVKQPEKRETITDQYIKIIEEKEDRQQSIKNIKLYLDNIKLCKTQTEKFPLLISLYKILYRDMKYYMNIKYIKFLFTVVEKSKEIKRDLKLYLGESMFDFPGDFILGDSFDKKQALTAYYLVDNVMQDFHESYKRVQMEDYNSTKYL